MLRIARKMIPRQTKQMTNQRKKIVKLRKKTSRKMLLKVQRKKGKRMKAEKRISVLTRVSQMMGSSVMTARNLILMRIQIGLGAFAENHMGTGKLIHFWSSSCPS